MWTYEHSIETDASPESIWPLYSDVPAWPRWDQGLEWVTLSGPFAAGSTGSLKVPDQDRRLIGTGGHREDPDHAPRDHHGGRRGRAGAAARSPDHFRRSRGDGVPGAPRPAIRRDEPAYGLMAGRRRGSAPQAKGHRMVPSRFRSAWDSPGFLLWHASLRWQRKMAAALRPVGLTHVQFVLLASTWWLATHGGQPTQRELADQAGTNEMMTSQVVRVLEIKGLITRKPDERDPRALRLGLTKQ